MTSLVVKHRKTYQDFLKLCNFWDLKFFIEHFLYLTSPLHWGIWGWYHYQDANIYSTKESIHCNSATWRTSQHERDATFMWSSWSGYCCNDHFLRKGKWSIATLQLCNSEDFVKLEGLNFVVVIMVTLLMFRLLGLSRTWWIIFDSSLHRYARNLPVSQQCLQIKCKLCQLIDVVSLWNTSSMLQI